jgi:hypothetical protein
MPMRRVTTDDLHYLAYHGLIRQRFRGGKSIRAWQKPDGSALLRLLERLERLTPGGELPGVTDLVLKTPICVTPRVTHSLLGERFFGLPHAVCACS